MSRRTGYLLAGLSAVCAGFSLTVGKPILAEMSSIRMTAWLFLFSVPLTAAWTHLSGGIPAFPRERPVRFMLLAITASAFVAIWAVWEGIRLLDPTVAAFLNRTEVIMIVFAGVVFLGERFRRVEILGAVVAIGGLVVLWADGSHGAGRESYTLGYFIMIGSSVAFAVTEPLAKVAVRSYPPVALAFWRNVLLAGLFGITAAATGDLGLPDLRQAGLILLLALLGPTAARILYLLSLSRLELSKAAIVTQTQPVFSALLAAAWLGQVPGTLAFVGGALVLGGAVVVIRGRGG